MFLPIAVATTDALLDALWIPGQIIIDHEATELEIDPFRARFGGNHDGGTLPEFLNQRNAYVHTFRAGEHVLSGMTLEPNDGVCLVEWILIPLLDELMKIFRFQDD